ncbi:Oidioi.mRNA.OKI2018_I69.chr2.g7095.t1.cds [Oikopleura dioica]|uniref:Polypeptide N-acetylgalactosaminyltransferase n=1 Tax=Oikopleura dioica TaxID=34765 RepID=A0ABN7TE76_OIKDI|nr:Oidioi.mRNA.OKI2018_I69.chr2.g7095.t1.cds [Oikopleura dioica]
MKVVHIQKKHLKRIIVAIFIFSCLVSFYFHSDSKPTSSKLHKKSEKKHKKHHSSFNPELKDDPVEDSLDAPSFDSKNEIPDFQSFNEDEEKSDEEIQLEKESYGDGFKKWRLEELDPTDYEGWPKLTNRAGNYEQRPEIPEVGSEGHDGTNTGEGGLSPIRLTSDDQRKVQAALGLWGFNMVASDKVNMDRIPADLRMEECKRWDYPDKLPAVSVILVFHNEGFSTLLRTVHSVVNYSPPEMLHEVVMLDDGSTREYITNGTIDRYIERWDGLVKIFHNEKREGLIRARTIGGKHSTGSVLVYLDAHCEVEPNWLPPLVTPIAKNYKVSTVPMIDSIDGNTYVFEPQQGGDENNLARGAWDWNFDWKRIPLNKREKARRQTISEPFRSPAMAGGLFAISRRWFIELGWYDDKLEIWGGENFELSYKLWQCGGELLFVPCSRVGHTYRMPGWGGNGTPDELRGKNFIAINYNRVIETWWDENYKKYYYQRRPENKNVDVGDLTDVLAIKEKLQCKDFSWYMREIAYDIPKYWPMVQPKNQAWGVLKNEGTGLCPNSRNSKQVDYPDYLYDTEKSEEELAFLENLYQEQIFDALRGEAIQADAGCNVRLSLTWREDIRIGDGPVKNNAMCWDDSMGANKRISYWSCHNGHGNQLYKYLPDTKQIYHPSHRLCVQMVEDYLIFAACDGKEPNQKWTWSEVDEEVLGRAMKSRNQPGDDPPELDYIQ